MKPVRLSQHAREEIARRGLSLDVVERVLRSPEQVIPAHGGLEARQSRTEVDGKRYLVRVIVTETEDAVVVVTAYRTGKIDRYWRSE